MLFFYNSFLLLTSDMLLGHLIFSSMGEVMKNLGLVGRSKNKNMYFCKNFFKILNHVFSFKKPRFDLESWVAMILSKVCSLYHDFPSFEDL